MNIPKKIPFGYRMANGRIIVHPEEANAVRDIFNAYISGESGCQIAKNMEVLHSGIKKWSCAAVRVILKNSIYTGTEQYPPLITEETFQAASRADDERNYKIVDISEELKALRKMTFCAECGQKLFPGSRKVNFDRWGCSYHRYRRQNRKMTAQELTDTILEILNTVIADPSLLDIPEEKCVIYSPDTGVIRQQNELRHMMESPQTDHERIRTELFRLAEMKYACCTYNPVPQKTEFLKKLLTNHEQLNLFDIGLLKSCAERITVSLSDILEIEFINGVKIHTKINRKE